MDRQEAGWRRRTLAKGDGDGEIEVDAFAEIEGECNVKGRRACVRWG